MRRLLGMILVTAVAGAVVFPAASGARSTVRTSDSFLEWPNLHRCGEAVSRTVRLGPRVAKGVRVLTPKGGQRVDDIVDHVQIGTVSEATVVRGGGRTSVRFTLTAAFAMCDGSLEGSFGAPDLVDYKIRFRRVLRRSELGPCRRVWMFFTNADVEANGYVRCSGARSLARAWRKAQECGMGCWRDRRRIRGFTCRVDSDAEGTWVNCRRGRKRVYWSYG